MRVCVNVNHSIASRGTGWNFVVALPHVEADTFPQGPGGGADQEFPSLGRRSRGGAGVVEGETAPD